ncbi:uncharacterized protein LOC116307677 [Actinia tenebrosa]|uniref:Uncharacterized protein LOC116307677 n=1 Tax=Actinia tenebrosa TaxID=6105 RepID=A0A6P8J7L6_ACTTE|nr:uncharacterized protein LOC116307677 [Actinia tenebrosa]
MLIVKQFQSYHSIMLFYVGLAVLSFCSFVSSTAVIQEDQSSSYTDWIKISANQVCFEGRHNRPGSLHNYVKAGLVVGIKLVHLSGRIRCVSLVEYDSRWGCGHYAPFKPNPLNVIVTDRYDQILFPRKENLGPHHGLWYWLPFTHSVESKELVFTNFGTPFNFPQNEEMKIWYGEDLRNWAEGDNQGRVCVEVYAKFLN